MANGSLAWPWRQYDGYGSQIAPERFLRRAAEADGAVAARGKARRLDHHLGWEDHRRVPKPFIFRTSRLVINRLGDDASVGLEV